MSSRPVQRAPLKGFLALTPSVPKESISSPSSRPGSLRGMAVSTEPLFATAFREHRGSSSSASSVSSEVGENGFLVLTPPDRVQDAGLRKIEEEAVE